MIKMHNKYNCERRYQYLNYLKKKDLLGKSQIILKIDWIRELFRNIKFDMKYPMKNFTFSLGLLRLICERFF